VAPRTALPRFFSSLLSALKRQHSVPQELDAAVGTILARLATAQRPVAMLTHLVSRYGVRDQ
jgi:indolepyruvate decarboxylase